MKSTSDTDHRPDEGRYLLQEDRERRLPVAAGKRVVPAARLLGAHGDERRHDATAALGNLFVRDLVIAGEE